MRRKRNLKTNQVVKHKAQLNVNGRQQEVGVNYSQTYAPVVTWFAIRFFIFLATINKWHLRQINVVMAYP